MEKFKDVMIRIGLSVDKPSKQSRSVGAQHRQGEKEVAVEDTAMEAEAQVQLPRQAPDRHLHGQPTVEDADALAKRVDSWHALA